MSERLLRVKHAALNSLAGQLTSQCFCTLLLDKCANLSATFDSSSENGTAQKRRYGFAYAQASSGAQDVTSTHCLMSNFRACTSSGRSRYF